MNPIRVLRTQHKIKTQKDLAKATGLSLRTISGLENGTWGTMNYTTLSRLATFFHVNQTQLHKDYIQWRHILLSGEPTASQDVNVILDEIKEILLRHEQSLQEMITVLKTLNFDQRQLTRRQTSVLETMLGLKKEVSKGNGRQNDSSAWKEPL